VVEVDVVSLAAEFPNDNPALHCGVMWICESVTGPATPEAAPLPVAIARVEDPPPVVAAEPEVQREPEPEPVTVVDEAPPTVVSEERYPSDAIADALLEALDSIEGPRESGILEIIARGDVEDDDEPILIEEISPLVDAEVIAAPSVAPVVMLVATPEPELQPEPEPEPAIASAPISIQEAIAPVETSVLPPASDDPFQLLCCALADVAIAADAPHAAAVLPALLLDGRIDAALPPEVMTALEEGGIVHGGIATERFLTVTKAWRAILLGTSDDFDACGGAMLDEWAADLLARLLGAPGRAALLRKDLRSRGVAAFGLAA
jgi:hypothetical protein